MNSIKGSLLIMLACMFVIACDQTEENSSLETATNTNTAETPLAINPAPEPSTNLHDIWVLDSMNDKVPDQNYFTRGTPYLDLNLDKKTFSGHTGCNSINGKLNEVSGKLVFDSLQVSKEVCKNQDFEKKLLKAFNKAVTYDISNDRLHMNIDAKTVYVFRRIRR